MNNRLHALQKFIENEPNDPFNWYALAMEYQSTDLGKYEYYLEELLTRFPTYLPTYYQAAAYWIAQQEQKKAIELLEQGIKLAKQQQNNPTLRELQNLLNEVLFDEG